MTNPSLKNPKKSVIPPNGNRQLKQMLYVGILNYIVEVF